MASAFASGTRGRCRLLLVGCALGSPVALAGGWQQSFSMPMTAERDSNPSMASHNPTVVARARVSPAYNLTGTFGVDEIGTDLALLVEDSSDKSISLSRRDPTAGLRWRRIQEKGEFALVAKYVEASTRATELDQSGLVVKDGTRKTASLAGNWRTALTARSTLAANADHAAVTHDVGGLNDYRNTSLGATWAYAWSAHAEPFIRLSANHYDPDGAVLRPSTHTMLTGGIKVQASEQLEWTAEADAGHFSGGGSRAQGRLKLRYAGLRHAAQFEISRSVAANSVSGFTESDQAKVGWSYVMDEHTNIGADASRRVNRALLPNAMNTFSAWLGRELSPRWQARFSYQFKQRHQSGIDIAKAGVVAATLTYTHPDF